jgi:hypothetical protein
VKAGREVCKYCGGKKWENIAEAAASASLKASATNEAQVSTPLAPTKPLRTQQNGASQEAVRSLR